MLASSLVVTTISRGSTTMESDELTCASLAGLDVIEPTTVAEAELAWSDFKRAWGQLGLMFMLRRYPR